MRQRKQRADLFEPIAELQDEEGAYTPRDFADWREIPSEALERSEIRALLAKALASLAQKYREVFILRDMEQISIEETAEVLNISIASVKTRLLRARLMLRDILAPDLANGWFSRAPFGKGSKPW
jgi:RNA polymerase sigma-70 factor (ECF subfamily)